MKKSHSKQTSFVGRSFLTPHKQQCLSEIVDENFKKARAVIYKSKNKKWLKNNIYHVFDLTAGNMVDKLTSPYIIINKLVKKSNELDFGYYLFEENKNTFESLKDNLNNYMNKSDWKNTINENVFLHQGNFSDNEVIDWDGFGHLGLCYFDPNGCGQKPEILALKTFTKNWPHIDILLNVNLHAWKRSYKAENKQGRKKDLISDQLTKMNKKNWWVREIPDENLQGGYKPLMLFGTNMPNYFLNRIDFHKAYPKELTFPCAGNSLLNTYEKFIES